MPLCFGNAADHSDSDVIGDCFWRSRWTHFVRLFEQRVVKHVQLRRKPPSRIQQRLRSCFRAGDNPCYIAGAKLRDEDFRLARKSQMQMKQGRTAREPCRQNACRQTARAIDVNERDSPPANDCGELTVQNRLRRAKTIMSL